MKNFNGPGQNPEAAGQMRLNTIRALAAMDADLCGSGMAAGPGQAAAICRMHDALKVMLRRGYAQFPPADVGRTLQMLPAKPTPEVILYQGMPLLLTAATAVGRCHPDIETVKNLAMEWAMVGRFGQLQQGAEVWQSHSGSGMRVARAFLHDVIGTLASPASREAARRTASRTRANTQSSQEYVRDVAHSVGATLAAPMDFQLPPVQGLMVNSKATDSHAWQKIKSRLFEKIRRSAEMNAAVAGYLWFLVPAFDGSSYLRVYFLLKPEGPGVYDRFFARVTNAWGLVTRGQGSVREAIGHANRIVERAHGMLGVSNGPAGTALHRALAYEHARQGFIRGGFPPSARIYGHGDSESASPREQPQEHSPADSNAAKAVPPAPSSEVDTIVRQRHRLEIPPLDELQGLESQSPYQRLMDTYWPTRSGGGA